MRVDVLLPSGDFADHGPLVVGELLAAHDQEPVYRKLVGILQGFEGFADLLLHEVHNYLHVFDALLLLGTRQVAENVDVTDFRQLVR